MKTTYILGIDTAKEKIRAALCGADERFLFERDLPVSAAALRELLSRLQHHVPEPRQLLVLIEATGVLHLNWAAALTQAGYAVAVLNPLMAQRLYSVENSIRDNKSDPVDARGLCRIGALHGLKLREKYAYRLEPERLALQRLQTVRQALRNALTNLKKTYQSLVELSFPELGTLLELDGVGLRSLLAQAPTPATIARKRLSTLKANWMLRPKAAALKALAANSIADPQLAAASAPALTAILQSLSEMETRLREVDRQIDQLLRQNIDPQTKTLVESMPGFGPTTTAKVLAYLPSTLLLWGSNRKVAARLQAFMGNDPRLKESGQWKGQTKMSKRGVETLRTAFFQAATPASMIPSSRPFTSANGPKAKLTTSLSAISCASSPDA